MDPNRALENLRDAVSRWREADGRRCTTKAEFISARISASAASVEMADSFEALDEWLSKGGFLPFTWQADRTEIETQ